MMVRKIVWENALEKMIVFRLLFMAAIFKSEKTLKKL